MHLVIHKDDLSRAITAAGRVVESRVVKVCGKCHKEKSLDEFYKNKDGKFGVAYACKSCDDERRRVSSAEKPDAKRASDAAWRANNPEKVKASRDKWRAENKDKKRDDDARWRRENPEKAKAKARRSSAKLRASASGRISGAVSASVRSAITKSAKRGRGTFLLLGYSVEDLMAHLERKFLPGMSWDNYGRGGWHIDHKIPQSAFHFETPEDIDFMRCWSLSNLQPMWERDNIKKGNKLERDFQPSLLIATNDNRRNAKAGTSQ